SVGQHEGRPQHRAPRMPTRLSAQLPLELFARVERPGKTATVQIGLLFSCLYRSLSDSWGFGAISGKRIVLLMYAHYKPARTQPHGAPSPIRLVLWADL